MLETILIVIAVITSMFIAAINVYVNTQLMNSIQKMNQRIDQLFLHKGLQND